MKKSQLIKIIKEETQKILEVDNIEYNGTHFKKSKNGTHVLVAYKK